MALEKLRMVILADDYAGYDVRGLVGQHGFSAYIEGLDDVGCWHRVLFDVGQIGKFVIHNAELLGIDLGAIDTIVLSHGHYDHTGGLLEVLDYIRSKRSKIDRLTIVAHPLAFKKCIHIGKNAVRLDVCMPFEERDVVMRGVNILKTRSFLPIANGIYFLGEIPRYYPDLVSYVEGMYMIENGVLKEHSFLDDTALVMDIRDLGLIVVAGCSHSGIANIVRYAHDKLSKKVHAVVGGLHLVTMDRDRIHKVISVLKELGVEEVHVGHCTGLYAEALLMQEYDDRFRKIYSGYTITFGGP